MGDAEYYLLDFCEQYRLKELPWFSSINIFACVLIGMLFVLTMLFFNISKFNLVDHSLLLVLAFTCLAAIVNLIRARPRVHHQGPYEGFCIRLTGLHTVFRKGEMESRLRIEVWRKSMHSKYRGTLKPWNEWWLYEHPDIELYQLGGLRKGMIVDLPYALITSPARVKGFVHMGIRATLGRMVYTEKV